MSALTFDTTTAPTEADVSTVRNALRAFNRQHFAALPERQLAAFSRTHDGRIVGGASGEIKWGWLHIDLLWVDEQWRGQGVGTRLLRDMEDTADRFAVTGYHLSTTSFQALDFYRRCGYTIWGELPGFPPGHINYALYKRATGHSTSLPDARGQNK